MTLTQEDLELYLDKYGSLQQVYRPPNKGFAFATFTTPTVIDRILAEPAHIIKGISVDIKRAALPPQVVQNTVIKREPLSGGNQHQGRNTGRSYQRGNSYDNNWGPANYSEDGNKNKKNFNSSSYDPVASASNRNSRSSNYHDEYNNTKRCTARNNGPLNATKSKILYLSNINANCGDVQGLKHYFESYGEIEEIFVPRGPNQQPRGFAFVTFSESSAVTRVLEKSGHFIRGVEVFCEEDTEIPFIFKTERQSNTSNQNESLQYNPSSSSSSSYYPSQSGSYNPSQSSSRGYNTESKENLMYPTGSKYNNNTYDRGNYGPAPSRGIGQQYQYRPF